MRKAFITLLYLAILNMPGLAAAQECKPLMLLNTIQMEPISNGMLVPLMINGSPRKLLLDTGGSATQLTWRAVEELKLFPQHGSLIITDFAGRQSDSFVLVDNVMFGRLQGKAMRFMVNPDGALGSGSEPFDGLLSGDLLLAYDVDIDFGTKILNFFSQDHCPGKVIHWKADAVAVQPVTIRNRSHLLVPVEIEGKTVTALIDTGASNSTMRLSAARRNFGLQKESGDPPIGSGVPGYIHSFSSLSFGDISVKNARVFIDTNESFTHGRPRGEPDLILGMNVLKHLHIYVAAKEGKLYISAASPPVVEPESGDKPKP